jgi:uncharacterized membrane protein
LAAIALRSTIALPLLWLAYAAIARGMNVERAGWWNSADSSTLWKVVLGSGVVAGALGMICFYSALNLAEVSRVKPIAFSIAPATAVIFGWLVLREPMTLSKAVGVALILAGVVLLAANGGSAERRNQAHEVRGHRQRSEVRGQPASPARDGRPLTFDL